MSEKHSEQVLQELYLKRKAHKKAPKQLNDQVLSYARQTKSPIWRWLNGPAISAAFLLVIVFGIQQNSDISDPVSTYTVSQGFSSDLEVVYYHDVHLQNNDVNHNEKSAGDAQYRQYLTALSELNDRKSLHGFITVNDDVMVIKVCDLGLVQLSQDVIKQLDQNEKISTLEIGSPVTLLADNSGRLHQIINSNTQSYDNNAEMCD
ncbi:hypothetical protein GCM10008107_20730 [Psychrosphaera saromensis]|uniref:Uncharacterized protein n=1 Tax=Psychrosphaera saromensis TaxID=716813 RepID=A0A2S7US03_9GAMM|nr:hypothetical protein [Psychrosphaera saromensis]PQJ52766.1 hypothetical protein BTO11_03245 [Psychrosphaera saromensis]GHB71073.1 hypothetical protein GCM10008107_20730 [Psychrosphaera saromensis]GLQ13259.1 hypothetical protein GCM10007917_07140 [Psychrosphaera saromensis]